MELPTQSGCERKVFRFGLVLALLLSCFSNRAEAESGLTDSPEALRLSADRIEAAGLVVHGLRLESTASGAFNVSFERLDQAGSSSGYGAVRLSGTLQRLEPTDIGWHLVSDVIFRGLEARVELLQSSAAMQWGLSIQTQPLARLLSLAPQNPVASWLQKGQVTARVDLVQPLDGTMKVGFRADLSGLSFDSPDGRFAGADLAARWQGSWFASQPLRLETTAIIDRGELLIDRFYADFRTAPLRVQADSSRAADTGAISVSFDLTDDGPAGLKGRLQAVDPADFKTWAMHFDALDLAFPEAYTRYLEPVAAAWTLDGLQLTGRLAWSGKVEGGRVRPGDLLIDDLTVVDTQRGRFALTGLTARLDPAWSGGATTLDWKGLLLGQVNLGAGQARLALGPEAITLLEPLTLDVLGGEVHLEQLRYPLPGADTPAFLKAGLRELELEPLTRSMGWPRFSGTISGDLPGASLENGVLLVDGAVQVDVFGGRLTVGELAVERPFGVLPSLAADITIHDLDLAQLTETFSFGRIGGRVDGYVRELRLLDWSPVAFDAWLGTPARQQQRRQISRQAVRNLADIGGGGATAALANPFLKLFNDFSYRRLGLGCRLENFVCEVRGVEDDGADDGAVVLLEGAGLPRVNINAYNRYIDWPQLMEILAAISSGGEIEVGEKP